MKYIKVSGFELAVSYTEFINSIPFLECKQKSPLACKYHKRGLRQTEL